MAYRHKTKRLEIGDILENAKNEFRTSSLWLMRNIFRNETAQISFDVTVVTHKKFKKKKDCDRHRNLWRYSTVTNHRNDPETKNYWPNIRRASYVEFWSMISLRLMSRRKKNLIKNDKRKFTESESLKTIGPKKPVMCKVSSDHFRK